jgi:hypothetical protein
MQEISIGCSLLNAQVTVNSGASIYLWNSCNYYKIVENVQGLHWFNGYSHKKLKYKKNRRHFFLTYPHKKWIILHLTAEKFEFVWVAPLEVTTHEENAVCC